MEEETDRQNEILENYEFTDEERIQIAINEFYGIAKTLYGDTLNEKINHIKIIRNNIINMTDTYLKKFNNELIMKDFYGKLKKAKEKASNNGKISKYKQYMNEIRVVQEFKSIKEKLAEKLAEQLFELFKKSERTQHAKT